LRSVSSEKGAQEKDESIFSGSENEDENEEEKL
jgi:hypothetical protein